MSPSVAGRMASNAFIATGVIATALEAEIDQWEYALYGFTKLEIAAVEGQ